jgi:hypothetical protein
MATAEAAAAEQNMILMTETAADKRRRWKFEAKMCKICREALERNEEPGCIFPVPINLASERSEAWINWLRAFGDVACPRTLCPWAYLNMNMLSGGSAGAQISAVPAMVARRGKVVAVGSLLGAMALGVAAARGAGFKNINKDPVRRIAFAGMWEAIEAYKQGLRFKDAVGRIKHGVLRAVQELEGWQWLRRPDEEINTSFNKFLAELKTPGSQITLEQSCRALFQTENANYFDTCETLGKTARSLSLKHHPDKAPKNEAGGVDEDALKNRNEFMKGVNTCKELLYTKKGCHIKGASHRLLRESPSLHLDDDKG